MFGNLGVHILKCPTGRYAYVGTLPTVLAEIVPATMADTMGGRSFRDDTGAIMAYRFPTFANEGDARIYAAMRGVGIIED